jgi:hypothetical protein
VTGTSLSPTCTDSATYDLGSWRLAPGRRVIFTSGTAVTEAQIKNFQITQPNGRHPRLDVAPSLPYSGSLVRPTARRPAPA